MFKNKKKSRPPSKLFLMCEETLQRVGRIEEQMTAMLNAAAGAKASAIVANRAASDAERAAQQASEAQQAIDARLSEFEQFEEFDNSGEEAGNE